MSDATSTTTTIADIKGDFDASCNALRIARTEGDVEAWKRTGKEVSIDITKRLLKLSPKLEDFEFEKLMAIQQELIAAIENQLSQIDVDIRIKHIHLELAVTTLDGETAKANSAAKAALYAQRKLVEAELEEIKDAAAELSNFAPLADVRCDYTDRANADVFKRRKVVLAAREELLRFETEEKQRGTDEAIAAARQAIRDAKSALRAAAGESHPFASKIRNEPPSASAKADEAQGEDEEEAEVTNPLVQSLSFQMESESKEELQTKLSKQEQSRTTAQANGDLDAVETDTWACITTGLSIFHKLLKDVVADAGDPESLKECFTAYEAVLSRLVRFHHQKGKELERITRLEKETSARGTIAFAHLDPSAKELAATAKALRSRKRRVETEHLQLHGTAHNIRQDFKRIDARVRKALGKAAEYDSLERIEEEIVNHESRILEYFAHLHKSEASKIAAEKEVIGRTERIMGL